MYDFNFFLISGARDKQDVENAITSTSSHANKH